jgi:hypothetical protein
MPSYEYPDRGPYLAIEANIARCISQSLLSTAGGNDFARLLLVCEGDLTLAVRVMSSATLASGRGFSVMVSAIPFILTLSCLFLLSSLLSSEGSY